MTKSTKRVPKHIETRYTDENECVLCLNEKNHDGYIRAMCKLESRLRMLHVTEWEAVNGAKPEGMELNHKCSNRGCCNVGHLELIDGSAHATLTNVNRVGYVMNRQSDEVIESIYERVKYKGEYINQMCREYDMKRSTISSIINKRSRCNITDEVDKKYLAQLQNIV